MDFEIFKGKDEQYYFRGLDQNKNNVLRSEGYAAKNSAKNAVESIKKNLSDRGEDSINLKTSKSGKEYFNIVAKNGQVIGTSKYFNSSSERDSFIDSII